MRILYATDGSEESLAGAQLLARLPLPWECRVKLLTVLPAESSEDADAILGPARRSLRATGVPVEALVRRGDAAAEILRAASPHASRPPTDLVVVGSRGLSGLARLVLGSVAGQVARHTTCPVLVARPIVNDLREVVVADDGSEGAARAVDWLQRFPLPEASQVAVATVPPGSGDPAEVLMQYSVERRADLLVVGSRGKSAVQRLLLGSVSEKVLRHARCSVLVVRSALQPCSDRQRLTAEPARLPA